MLILQMNSCFHKQIFHANRQRGEGEWRYLVSNCVQWVENWYTMLFSTEFAYVDHEAVGVLDSHQAKPNS